MRDGKKWNGKKGVGIAREREGGGITHIVAPLLSSSPEAVFMKGDELCFDDDDDDHGCVRLKGKEEEDPATPAVGESDPKREDPSSFFPLRWGKRFSPPPYIAA